MTNEMICCPKCNGSGQIKKPRPRAKIVKSYDPDKKWCYKCKTFMLKKHFYGKNSYCKTCENGKEKKFTCTCVICLATFKAKSTYTVFCSKWCYMKRKKDTRQLREHELLPNYLTEEYKE